MQSPAPSLSGTDGSGEAPPRIEDYIASLGAAGLLNVCGELESEITIAFGAGLREHLATRKKLRGAGRRRPRYYVAIERGEFNVSPGTMLELAAAVETMLAALLRRVRL